MMIGAQLNSPADWLRAGGAVQTVDEFVAIHGGNAPVFVFVDPTGAFGNDTECVNGPRGNASLHLTKDVVPYMISNVGVGPNSGDKTQTITRLFGGDADAWAGFDPATVIARHGQYRAVSGLFEVGSPDIGADNRDAANPEGQDRAAAALATLGAAHGIACSVMELPGRHDWPFAAYALRAALPWLAGQLHTPGVPAIALRGKPAMALHPTVCEPPLLEFLSVRRETLCGTNLFAETAHGYQSPRNQTAPGPRRRRRAALGRNPAARRKFPPLHPTTHTYLTTALTLACRSQGDVVTLLAYTGM